MVARATVAETDGDGGDKEHMEAARNVVVASCDVALPSPLLDTASESTVVVPPPVPVVVVVDVCSSSSRTALMNLNRWFVAS